MSRRLSSILFRARAGADGLVRPCREAGKEVRRSRLVSNVSFGPGKPGAEGDVRFDEEFEPDRDLRCSNFLMMDGMMDEWEGVDSCDDEDSGRVLSR